jgi:hypothetical protein
MGNRDSPRKYLADLAARNTSDCRTSRRVDRRTEIAVGDHCFSTRQGGAVEQAARGRSQGVYYPRVNRFDEGGNRGSRPHCAWYRRVRDGVSGSEQLPGVGRSVIL